MRMRLPSGASRNKSQSVSSNATPQQMPNSIRFIHSEPNTTLLSVLLCFALLSAFPLQAG